MIDLERIKEPAIPQIFPQLPSMLPLKIISVLCLPPSDSPDLLPSYDPNTLDVIKKDVHILGRVKWGYCCEKHDKKICYKNTWFYWSTWYDKTKEFYYCRVFSRISSETRSCFLGHKHSMSPFFSWLLCLYPIHPLLYLLNLFCACFLIFPLITPCNMAYFCSIWLFDLVLFF